MREKTKKINKIIYDRKIGHYPKFIKAPLLTGIGVL